MGSQSLEGLILTFPFLKLTVVVLGHCVVIGQCGLVVVNVQGTVSIYLNLEGYKCDGVTCRLAPWAMQRAVFLLMYNLGEGIVY
jgi:hypothetical protein